jgi:FAD/FMN-containing dehydrogenase
LVDCSAQQNPDLWQASRLHLGALGIITRLQLQLQPAYRLVETAWNGKLDEVLDRAEDQAEKNRHHEFFWYPQTDQTRGKSINLTTEPAVYPLGDEGHRCAWSYEVLPNHRPHKHTEMEYSVPAAQGPACMAAIRDLLTTRFKQIAWPVEYRTLAADDVWLSTAYGRDTVTISVHQDVNEDDEPYFRACEEIFLAHQGLPHWGKVHYLSGPQLTAGHTRWVDWWRVRDDVDPHGTFLNDYMQHLR